MLYFIFTIDGDWGSYFSDKLPDDRRRPGKDNLLWLLDEEIKLAKSLLDGKFIHFVHSSPVAHDYYKLPEVVEKWHEMEKVGGDVGVHCHEEELGKAFHFDDQERMEKSITNLTDTLTEMGLRPRTYRGGYMTFSPRTIPILEENGLFLDFSCDPGRRLVKTGRVVSDWQGAPENFYRMSYDDHRKPGDSRVFEIPLGIYIEQRSLWSIWQKLKKLRKRKGAQIVSVMAHTYDFPSAQMRLKMKLALLICKRYGKFIGVDEVLKVVANEKLEKTA